MARWIASSDGFSPNAHTIASSVPRRQIGSKTFGPFSVLVDGRPLVFSSEKARELFALLVQKQGQILTAQEALDCIWDGREYDKGSNSVFRVTMMRLKDILEDAGVGSLLQSSSRGKYLDTSQYKCDLNDFLAGDPAAIQRFNGEYLSEYSWGEETLALLLRISRGELYKGGY